MSARLVVWAARALWAVVGFTGWLALAGALDGRGSAAIVVEVVALAVFAVGVVALVVPSTVGLTALRMIAPLAPVAAIAAVAGGAGLARGLPFLALALLTAIVIGAGEVGEAFVQASAYGDEQRFPLRPAVGFLLAVGVAWAAWAALLVTGGVLVAHEVWVAGVVLLALGVGLAWPLGERCHRLARRWLVVVPAGLVVHDHLVLAETLLVPRAGLTRAGLALAGTGAADLTGPSGGHPVEIAVDPMLTIPLAPASRGAAPSAIHAAAFLVAPTRPGRALAAAAARGLPIAS